MGQRRLPASAPLPEPPRGRQGHSLSGRRPAGRPGVADLRPLGQRRQVADRGDAGGARRPPGHRQARSVNLKFFLEGEEEAGSEHLRAMLSAHAETLKADAWLFFDGPVHQTRRPQVSFGVRGVTGVNLTVYGPLRPLHSGHYGTWAPNPNVLMAHLIASLRDPDGGCRITEQT